jgi:hypothetical protein
VAPDEEITPVDYQPIDDLDNEGLGEDNSDRPDNQSSDWQQSDKPRNNVNFDY